MWKGDKEKRRKEIGSEEGEKGNKSLLYLVTRLQFLSFQEPFHYNSFIGELTFKGCGFTSCYSNILERPQKANYTCLMRRRNHLHVSHFHPLLMSIMSSPEREAVWLCWGYLNCLARLGSLGLSREGLVTGDSLFAEPVPSKWKDQQESCNASVPLPSPACLLLDKACAFQNSKTWDWIWRQVVTNCIGCPCPSGYEQFPQMSAWCYFSNLNLKCQPRKASICNI